jgi:hypothetical protein
MGTRNGFPKAIRHLFRALTPEQIDKFVRVVDGSYVLYMITRRNHLGNKLFKLDPQNQVEVDSIVKAIVESMLAFLTPYDIKPSNCIFFLEGSIPKIRHAALAQQRAGRLSKAIRLLKRCSLDVDDSVDLFIRRRVKSSETLISEAYGRPKPWLTKLIAEELADRNYHVDYSDKVEADFRICKFSKQLKQAASRDVCDHLAHQVDGCALELVGREVMVVGSDSDFIALSPANSVDVLAKIERGSVVAVRKDDVLKDLRLNEFQLLLAFCVGGCDNVPTNLFGIAWKGAAKYVAGLKDKLNPNILRKTKMLSVNKFGTNEERKQIVKDIVQVLQDFGWFPTPGSAKMQLAINETTGRPRRCEAYDFADERDANGKLVRPAIYKIIMKRSPDPEDLPHVPSPQKRPTEKGTKAPLIPKPRKLPANSFFVLNEFVDNAANSWKDGLHLLPEDRAKWIVEGRAAAEAGRSRKQKNTDSEVAADGDGQEKTKSKKKSSGNRTTVTESGVATEDDATKSRKRKKSTAEPQADTQTPTRTKKRRDSKETAPGKGKNDSKKSNKNKPKLPSREQYVVKKEVPENKQREKADKGVPDPKYGTATLSKPTRMSLEKKHETFTIRMGKLKHWIKSSTEGISAEYLKGVRNTRENDEALAEVCIHASFIHWTSLSHPC